MNYWLHRCAYEGGFKILDEERRLTIGFSACANDADMLTAIRNRNGSDFDAVYKKIYSGGIWRGRWSLWYFTHDMAAGDVIVVPRYGGFSVCRLKGEWHPSALRTEKDIGFEWDVEVVCSVCSPREAYATTALLSRMKCRQTTLNISDLASDVGMAMERSQKARPFSLPTELAQQCHKMLDEFGSPDHFERLLLDYFRRLGATAEILPKNYNAKVGDCDVSAVFPALRLTVSVQAKKHWGKTGEWSVQQIIDYAGAKSDVEPNWTYANWVVSFADDFTESAKQLAAEHDVILLNGIDFCKMLVANGISML